MKALRVPELDGVRGIAAAGVVFFHVSHQALFWYWSAMDLFFILSAYLIGAQLMHAGISRESLFKYFKRRIVRIWPPYFITVFALLAAVFAMRRLHIGSDLDPGVFWRYATFTQYLDVYWLPHEQVPKWSIATHLWSLAVEEQFYVLLPLLVLALTQARSDAARYAIVGALVACGFLARATGVHFYALLQHADAFALGLLIVLLQRYFKDATATTKRNLAWLMGLGFLGTLPYLVHGYLTLGQGASEAPRAALPMALSAMAFDAFWVGMLGLVIANQGGSRIRFLRLPFCVYLGRVSYVLYLVHYPVFLVARRLVRAYFGDLHVDKVWVAVACLPVVFLLAHLFYVLLDKKLQEGRSIASRAPPMPVPQSTPALPGGRDGP